MTDYEELPTLAGDELAGDKVGEDKVAGDKAGQNVIKHVGIANLQGSPLSLTGDATTGPLIKAADDIIIQTGPTTTPQLDPLPEARKLLDSMPIDRPVEAGDLPAHSRMPLSRNPLFIGREKELQRLAATVKVGGTVAIQQAAAVTGMGPFAKA